MKNRRCPNRYACFGYDEGSCDTCDVGILIDKLYKRINRLKKQNETLTIQRNAWAFILKAIKADTVKKMQERLYRELAFLGAKDKFNKEYFLTEVDRVAKEILEGKK